MGDAMGADGRYQRGENAKNNQMVEVKIIKKG